MWAQLRFFWQMKLNLETKENASQNNFTENWFIVAKTLTKLIPAHMLTFTSKPQI
jgi:hypothetical protein